MATLAALLVIAAAVLNYRGINLAGWTQTAIITVIIAMLLAAVAAAAPGVRPAAFVPFAPHGWPAVGTSMTLLFWAFVGWEMTAHLAEEFVAPSRDIPRALAAALVVINVLYLAVAFVTVGTAVYLTQGGGAPLTALVSGSWGRGAAAVTAVLGLLVCYGTLHTYVTGFSRLVYAQARDGNFPAVFARLQPRFRTPYAALGALAIVQLAVVAAYAAVGLDLTLLIRWVCAVFIVLYIIAMAAAIRLFAAAPRTRALAWLSLAVCLTVFPFTGWTGLYPLALASAGWLAYRRKFVRGIIVEKV